MTEKGDMTTREAGARGGAKVLEKYGKEFFEKIGKEGRKKAAATIQTRYGDDYYRKIGAIGGARMRELIQKGRELEKSGSGHPGAKERSSSPEKPDASKG